MNIKHSYLIIFWSPFSESGADSFIGYFSSFFQRYGDIQCLDCKNNQDARTFRLMRQADLVVILLHQSRRELCSVFCRRKICFPNCVYLILDYVSGDELSLNRISFEFRISPSHLAGISYNPRLREDKKWPDTGLFSQGFRRELCRAGQIMLLALGF